MSIKILAAVFYSVTMDQDRAFRNQVMKMDPELVEGQTDFVVYM